MSAEASSHAASTSAKLPWYSSHSQGAVRATSRKYSATLGSRSTAIRRPFGPSIAATASAWPPAPKVQSTATSSFAGRSSSSSSSRRTGVWARAISYSRSCKLVCGSIGLLLQAGLVVSPGGAVPDLNVVLDADDTDFSVDAGELEMPGRHRDAPLPVELLMHGVARREAHEVTTLAAVGGDALHLPLEVLLELLGRVAGEAVLVALGHVDAAGERRSQTRGDGDAVLRVEREVVLPHQDRSLHGRHFTPLFPTLQ